MLASQASTLCAVVGVEFFQQQKLKPLSALWSFRWLDVCNQNRWFQKVTKNLPSTHPALLKVYYVAVTTELKSNKFKWLVHTLIDGDHLPLNLVHYLGDLTVAA